MLDVLLSGGTVVDGTGRPGVRAEVGIRAGRVVHVGAGDAGPAARTVDVTGLVVAPGVVDPHTHYDAQLLWDPTASPSNVHGVTTVIGGNCGFTLAPLRPDDADYLRRLMARVEGMPLGALETGLDWDWESFGDYLAKFEGNLAVNAGFLVGHCAIRRTVMGVDAVGGTPTPEQLDAMGQLLAESLAAGGLGFSSSQAYTHSDGDGAPVPSRHAHLDEMLALCEVVRHYPGTTLEYITDGCLNGFADEEIERMARMSATAGRPLNWNVLTVDARDPERVANQLRASDRAAALGGRVVALTMPTAVGMNMSFANFCALWLIPGWDEVYALPIPERTARLRDPKVRAQLDALAHSEAAGVMRRLAGWGGYRIGDTFSAANAGLSGQTVREIAEARGTSDFDTLLDVVVADDLRTVLWPSPTDDDGESWRMRAALWEDPRVMIGGSDAGAHLDRMCGAPYPTAFLADCLRGRRLVPMETAVRLMTSVPADLFGLVDRGRVVEGAIADLMVFDPATVDAGPVRTTDDLPGANKRLVADAIGVPHVFVGGEEIVRDGVPTAARPGTLLRSGTHTRDVRI
ncbi:MAG: N-acyl-D-amino-acid deacylase family protein [Actinomycetota bacterium]